MPDEAGCAHRDLDELKGHGIDDHQDAVIADAVAARQQGQQRRAELARRSHQCAPGVAQRCGLGADTVGPVVERVADGALVVAGHGRAKAEVIGQQSRAAAELLCVLREQAAQHMFTVAQLVVDLHGSVAIDAVADGDEGDQLHEQQQREEQGHDAHVQPAVERPPQLTQGRHQAAHLRARPASAPRSASRNTKSSSRHLCHRIA